MDDVRLVLANIKYRAEYLDFIEECRKDIIETGFDCVIPVSDENTFEADINRLTDRHKGRELPENWVPASTYWLIKDNSKIMGVIIIRHRLNDQLRFRGGHIAYYIRPSERKKSYATRMLSMALEQCRELGLKQVLITCKKENEYSAKTIKNNGGELFSEGHDNGQIIQRYWIQLGSLLLSVKL